MIQIRIESSRCLDLFQSVDDTTDTPGPCCVLAGIINILVRVKSEEGVRITRAAICCHLIMAEGDTYDSPACKIAGIKRTI